MYPQTNKEEICFRQNIQLKNNSKFGSNKSKQVNLESLCFPAVGDPRLFCNVVVDEKKIGNKYQMECIQGYPLPCPL